MRLIDIHKIEQHIQQDASFKRLTNISNVSKFLLMRDSRNIRHIRVDELIALSEWSDTHDDIFNVKYVGIDIGTSNVVTCSDLSLKHVMQYHDTYGMLKKSIKKYRLRQMNNEDMAKQKFKNRIRTDIRNIVREIVNYYPKHAEFVVGVTGGLYRNNDTTNIIREVFIETLKNELKLSQNIQLIDETNTSITCPICDHVDKSQRTGSNRFSCKQCDFRHTNDDAVACVNIIRAYIKENRLTID